MTAFNFIDLFAGIGGMRIAFERVGGKCVFSSEINRFARKTYFANFGEILAGDIKEINENDIPDHNILLAGFPCQPFSISGVSKRKSLNMPHGFRDRTKGTLFFDIARILEAKKPEAFLLENVKHLKHHDHGRTYRVIRGTLEDDLKYNIWDEVIDARFVVPQHRERFFIAGFKEPMPFKFPEFEDQKPRLGDILVKNVELKYTLVDHLWDYLKKYAARHREKGNGFGYSLADLEGITRTLSARYISSR